MKNNVLKSKIENEKLQPKDIPSEYYGFAHYVTKERMLTYWHQVDEILKKKPEKVLEIGKGNGIVSGMLTCYGIGSVTADINESLKPDVVASITELENHFSEGQFPFILCARVLQHLPFSEFERVLSQLHFVTSRHVLLTLPVDDLRLYFRFRITGKRAINLSISFPLMLKRLLYRIFSIGGKSNAQNFWKINQSREVSLSKVCQIIQNNFHIEKYYRVSEDMSHAFFLLRKM